MTPQGRECWGKKSKQVRPNPPWICQKELDILKIPEEERKEYEAYQENLHYEASMHESTYKVDVIEGKK